MIGRQLIRKQNQVLLKNISNKLGHNSQCYFCDIIDLDDIGNQKSYFQNSSLRSDILKSIKVENQLSKKMNQNQRKGILSSQIQRQLLQINNLLLERNEDGNNSNDEDNTNYQTKKNDSIQNCISQYLEIEYNGLNADHLVQFLNKINEDEAKNLNFYSVCAFIIEIGRNPRRTRFKYIYKKTLNKLVKRFSQLNPMILFLQHLQKNNNVFDKSDYSPVEFEYLRFTLPRIIICLQNCGFIDNSLYDQYYQIFTSQNFQYVTNMQVKVIVGLMWSYARFQRDVDYDQFINYIFRLENHTFFLNTLRLLNLSSTHFRILDDKEYSKLKQEYQSTLNSNLPINIAISKSQLENIKQFFIDKLNKQVYINFNEKNSTQIIQILYKLYPQYVIPISQNDEKSLQNLMETDKFFRLFYPLALNAQKIMRFKNENKDQKKIMILNRTNDQIQTLIKPAHNFQLQSKFQVNVLNVLTSMFPDVKIKQNLYIGDIYEIDILFEDLNIVFEINGDSHYYYDSSSGKIKIFAKTICKQQVLKTFGIKHIVNINQYHWYKLNQETEKQVYIIKQLQHAKVNFASLGKIIADQQILLDPSSIQNEQTSE
ncbi:RAP domain protein (macronuclear) [Tetrahymena thermophila SB210]|uniref:RAP domain protein n=1 Tax=Tetrahymena thermophila (strain SB210) TaxID=312017 RepID=Q23MG3_TETTS|nr:RAP domain protein [Tetrahymena thermophila SB210]EAR97676.2 RAP domain protein [Tetrahymena thermophila SB210]|eukprot:XP_001017921.2 RAP domain protein [Tetrahymena thermophila SB210]